MASAMLLEYVSATIALGGIEWEGPACQCNDFVTCSGNGECNFQGDCVCIGNFAGQHCRQCKPNYFGTRCQFYCNAADAPSPGKLGCYGRGICSVLDEGTDDERITCECNNDGITLLMMDVSIHTFLHLNSLLIVGIVRQDMFL